jgi:hypothetical protein
MYNSSAYVPTVQPQQRQTSRDSHLQVLRPVIVRSSQLHCANGHVLAPSNATTIVPRTSLRSVCRRSGSCCCLGGLGGGALEDRRRRLLHGKEVIDPLQGDLQLRQVLDA